MENIIINGNKLSLPCHIRNGQSKENSMIDLRVPFDGKLVFISNDRFSVAGKPVAGGILVLKNKITLVRIKGVVLKFEIPEIMWLLKPYDYSQEICSVCRLPFEEENVWQCTGCGVIVHDSPFCKPLSPDEPCFRCQR